MEVTGVVGLSVELHVAEFALERLFLGLLASEGSLMFHTLLVLL